MRQIIVVLVILGLALQSAQAFQAVRQRKLQAGKLQAQTTAKAYSWLGSWIESRAGADPHFAYKCEGEEAHICPAAWGTLVYTDKKNECAQTERQSPINLPSFATTPGVPHGGHTIATAYTPIDLAKTKVFNNGHTTQVNSPDGANTLTLTVGTESRQYQLKQFHMHASSEHTIGGQSFPFELHLVHLLPDNAPANSPTGYQFDKALVIGLLFKTGAENAELAKFFNKLPAAPLEGVKETVATAAGLLDLNNLIGKNGLNNFWHYKGSLTTPPCSQIVDWHVLSNEHTLSQAQVSAFKAILPEHENNRPTQKTQQVVERIAVDPSVPAIALF